MQFVSIGNNNGAKVRNSDVMHDMQTGLQMVYDGRCTCTQRYSRREHIISVDEYGMYKRHAYSEDNKSSDLPTFLLYFYID